MAGIINGTNLRLYKGSNAIAYALECTLDFSREMTEQLHKDNAAGDWPTRSASTKNCSISFSALYADDASATNFNELWTDWDGGTGITAKVSTGTTGEDYWSGTFLVESLSLTAPDKEDSSYSGTLVSSGAVTMAQEA